MWCDFCEVDRIRGCIPDNVFELGFWLDIELCISGLNDLIRTYSMLYLYMLCWTISNSFDAIHILHYASWCCNFLLEWDVILIYLISVCTTPLIDDLLIRFDLRTTAWFLTWCIETLLAILYLRLIWLILFQEHILYSLSMCIYLVLCDFYSKQNRCDSGYWFVML